MSILDGGLGFNQGQAKQERAVMERGGYQSPTYTERVRQACDEAERRAADLKRVREILERNPELEELLTILGRVHV